MKKGVALKVTHFFVKSQIVRLKRFDLGSKFTDRFELTSKFFFEFSVATAESIALGRDDGQDAAIASSAAATTDGG